MKLKTIIFSDLDGTFLDDGYGYEHTKPIVDELVALGCSIVFCSSKTKNEIEFYRKAIGSNEPFISENGAAIFIPRNYFPLKYISDNTSRYHVIRLSRPYSLLRNKLLRIKEKTAAQLLGFGDMTFEELSLETGLPLSLAKLAKMREHCEPFRIINGNLRHIISAIKKEGLHCTKGGRYFHLTDGTDKGNAIAVLRNLYCQAFGSVETLGVGDGPNDISMFKTVDKPFFIKRNVLTSSCKTWARILSHVSGNLNP